MVKNVIFTKIVFNQGSITDHKNHQLVSENRMSHQHKVKQISKYFFF